MRFGGAQALGLIFVIGCGSRTSSNLTCGPGTVARNNECVPTESSPPDAGIAPDAATVSIDASLPDVGADLDAGAIDAGDALPPGIYAIAGLDDTLPHGDLLPLANLIGQRSVVALGESVHTSGGYSDAKVRIFRALVEDHGFRGFAIESPWVDATPVTSYVDTCSGSAFDAVTQGLFGVWANTAMKHLVEWMCGWNQAHPADPVHFFGFDTQEPWSDGGALKTFLTKAVASSSVSQHLKTGLSNCDGADDGTADQYYAMHPTGTTTITAAEFMACTMGLDAIDAVLLAQGSVLAARTSTTELELAKIHALSVRSWELESFHWYANPQGDMNIPASFDGRDHGMAQVFLRLRALRYPGKKIAIWAHNAHIRKHGDRVEGGWGGARNMGSYLSEALADDYFTLGLVGYNVEINWPGVGMGPTALPPDGAVETELHALGAPLLFVDLSFAGAAMPFLTSGQTYPLGEGEQMVPLEQFNALVYIDHSPPMHALLW
jgi:erythromycin esterase-like protein